MIQNHKKGEVLEIAVFGAGQKHICGVVWRSTSQNIVLAHNFSGIKPIDISIIGKDDIVKEKTVIPLEINKADDLIKIA